MAAWTDSLLPGTQLKDPDQSVAPPSARRSVAETRALLPVWGGLAIVPSRTRSAPSGEVSPPPTPARLTLAYGLTDVSVMTRSAPILPSDPINSSVKPSARSGSGVADTSLNGRTASVVTPLTGAGAERHGVVQAMRPTITASVAAASARKAGRHIVGAACATAGAARNDAGSLSA